MFATCVALALLILILSVVRRSYQSVILAAYILRVILSYIHAYVLVLPDSQFDAIRFERVAWMWAEDGRCFNDFTTGSLLYSWIGSCFYILSGRSPLLLQVLNAFFGTVIVLVGMKIMRLLSPHGKEYRYVGWLLALHPSLVLYSAITMREVAVVLPFVVSLYWLVKWRMTGRYSYGLWSILWMTVSQMFHTGVITATVLIAVIFAYYTVTEHWWGLTRLRIAVRHARATTLSLVIIAALSIVVPIMLNEGYGLDKFGRLGSQGVVGALSGWQEQVARGRASYLTGLHPGDWVGLLLQLPIRLAYFMGAPFAWTIANARDLWGFIDAGFLTLLSLQVVRHIKNGAWRRRAYCSIAVVTFAVIIGFAAVTSNYGTAFRHRAKFVPALIIVYAYGSSERKRKQKRDSTALESVKYEGRGCL